MTADQAQGPDVPGNGRLVVYILDGGGRDAVPWTVPPHVFTALRGLRPLSRHVAVGVRREISAEDRAELESLADTVMVGGRDVGHGRLVDALGASVAGYDQVILTTSDWFGPIADAGAVLERMADVPEWSLVPLGDGAPWDGSLRLRPDESWYVLPGSRAASPDHAAWRSGAPLPVPTTAAYAFAPASYRSPDPALMSLPDLLDAGLPFVPRRSFGVDPLVADRLALVPADGLARLETTGADMDEVWRGLLDVYPLRVLTTNLGLTRVLTGSTASAGTSLRTVAVLHLYYVDLTDELMDRVDLLPGEVDLVVTTTDDTRKEAIEARLATRPRQYRQQVRVVASNRGRDISAFLVGCADVLADESYDIVVKLHGKGSVQDDANASAWFRRHLLDNLLGSRGEAHDLYDWFEEDRSLGIAVPPVIHMYYPTMGHAWLGNRSVAERLADRLGLTVPFDEHTPVAAYGSMFVARREALVPWLTLGLTWDDFPDGAGYADGTLAHAIERMFCYVAAQTGRYTGTVLGRSVAGLEYGFLEYKVQAVGSHLPAYAIDQVGMLEGRHGSVRQALVARMPRLSSRLRPLYRALNKLRRSRP